MSRGKASGIHLTKSDARVVLGMVARGDRDHDIAAWFGVNQGRIAEVKNGDYGTVNAASTETLPPKGPPGVKGRRLRRSIGKALEIIESKGVSGLSEAAEVLKKAEGRYDADEA